MRRNAWNWFLVLLAALLTVCSGGVGWAQTIDWTKPFELAANIDRIDAKPWANVGQVSGKAPGSISGISGVNKAAAASCGTCGSQQVFNWTCASESDISSGGGCNASSANCSVTLGTGASIVSGELSITGATQTASTVTISGLSASSGTLTFSFKTTGYGSTYNEFNIITLRYDTDDYIRIMYNPNNNKIKSYYVGGGTSSGGEHGVTLSRNTAHTIRLDWEYAGNVTLNWDTQTARNDAISAVLNGAPVTIEIGGSPYSGDSWVIDNIIIYSQKQS